MRVLINVASQYVSACILNLPRHFLHRPDGTLRALLFGLQGGGVVVDSNGVANFEGCNVHGNTAATGGGGGLLVFGTATLINSNIYFNTANAAWNREDGGGLYISGTATLTNTNVYQNEANYVRACFLNRHPSPR